MVAPVPKYVELLYQALNAPVGIAVETDNLSRAREALYRAKRYDPDFAALAIILSPFAPTSELWIIKKVPDHAKEQAPDAEGDADPVRGRFSFPTDDLS